MSPTYGPCDDFTTPAPAVWQNPAISGYQYGWISCTCFAAAGVGREATCGHRNPTGGGIREHIIPTDHSGGTTLAQVDGALQRGWDIDLDVRYGYPWSEFVERVSGGQPAILQGHGSAFIGTKYFANASVNHALYIPGGPNWRDAVDPAADGRYEGIYKSHGEAYPEWLLRKFAGLLIISAPGRPIVRLGSGRCYAAFAHDTTADWRAVIRPEEGEEYREFTVHDVRVSADGHRYDVPPGWKRRTKGFAIPCTSPKRVAVGHPNSGTSVSLVKLTHPGHRQDGWWVSSRWAREVLSDRLG